MKPYNSYYFNVYKISIKLLPLLTVSILLGCSEQKEAKQVLQTERLVVSEDAININTASAAELEKLPHIGAQLAQKIIEQRENFGKFRKAEFLMLIDGISDARFRQIKNLAKVE